MKLAGPRGGVLAVCRRGADLHLPAMYGGARGVRSDNGRGERVRGAGAIRVGFTKAYSFCNSTNWFVDLAGNVLGILFNS